MKNLSLINKSDLSGKHSLFLALGLILSTLVTGCGKEEFLKQEYIASGSSMGYQVIPAKADILIVTDNSASFSNAIGQFQSQLGSFVNNLTAQGWDYHIAAMPLAISQPGVTLPTFPIQTVLVDAEKNSPVLRDGMPNPGYSASGAVPSTMAINNPSSLGMVYTTNYSWGSQDQTLRNIVNTLNYDATSMSSAHFSRPDAMLAVVVITNGNDFSPVPAGQLAQSYWGQQILNAARRTNAQSIQFFPIASQLYRTEGCWNDGANPGTRYFDIARYFNSPAGYDFCQSNLSDVVRDIASRLQIQKNAYVTRGIFLSVRPIAESIHIYRISASGAETEIPRDRANGWSYDEAGQPRTDYSILEPLSLDRRTGYMIELNGSGRIKGDERYRIVYSRY